MKTKSGFLRFPAVAALALATAFSTVPLMAQNTQNSSNGTQTQQNAANTQGKANWHAKRLDQLTTLLNLSSSQQQQAQTIFQNARQQAQPLMAQLRQNRQQIQNLITSGNTSQFDSQIQNLSNTEGSLIGQMIAVRTKAYEQFYHMLNPDQQAKAKDLYQLMTSRRHFRWEVAPSQPGPGPATE